jgi:hypothetical protein
MLAVDLGHCHVMAAIRFGLFGALGSALRTRGGLVLENLALRQQLATFKRRDPRLRLTHPDRLFWIAPSRAWSRWREALVVVKPETVVGWHRWAFRRFCLHRILKSYFAYYLRSRTHLSLGKDAPEPRAVHPPSMGEIVELPEVGGLHHRYERLAA